MKLNRGLLLAVILVAGCANNSGPVPQAPDSEIRYVPGQVIVKYREGMEPQVRAGTFKQVLSGGEVLLEDASRSADQDAVFNWLRELRQDPAVEYAQPNYIYQAQLTPNDEFYSSQWHYPLINLPQAWDKTTGDNSVVIAVIDSGSSEHPDLQGQWLPGYDFTNTEICDITGCLPHSGDGDGPDADATDLSDSRHGTHVAGTIAALSNNQIGVAGICWHCRILPVRVLGQQGTGDTKDLANAVRWAAGLTVFGVPRNYNPARVINLSLAGPVRAPCAQGDPVMTKAIQDARAAGALVVVAAGNFSEDASYYSPASCSQAVTVTAVDQAGKLANYSNFGSYVDVAAPGGDVSIDLDHDQYPDGVLSTFWGRWDGFNYSFLEGTSMASPHVAGVIGLMLSQNPALTPAEIETKLATSAQPLSNSACRGGCGAGLIDAAAALR